MLWKHNTIVLNGVNIAYHLKHSEQTIVTWLTQKTGATCKVQNHGWELSGSWTDDQLQEWLDLFVMQKNFNNN
jgi:translation initiation factor 2 beta subunit (eIF-2beta)/eIF-5